MADEATIRPREDRAEALDRIHAPWERAIDRAYHLQMVTLVAVAFLTSVGGMFLLPTRHGWPATAALGFMLVLLFPAVVYLTRRWALGVGGRCHARWRGWTAVDDAQAGALDDLLRKGRAAEDAAAEVEHQARLDDAVRDLAGKHGIPEAEVRAGLERMLAALDGDGDSWAVLADILREVARLRGLAAGPPSDGKPAP
jgi:hypothetical protein